MNLKKALMFLIDALNNLTRTTKGPIRFALPRTEAKASGRISCCTILFSTEMIPEIGSNSSSNGQFKYSVQHPNQFNWNARGPSEREGGIQGSHTITQSGYRGKDDH